MRILRRFCSGAATVIPQPPAYVPYTQFITVLTPFAVGTLAWVHYDTARMLESTNGRIDSTNGRIDAINQTMATKMEVAQVQASVAKVEASMIVMQRDITENSRMLRDITEIVRKDNPSKP